MLQSLLLYKQYIKFPREFSDLDLAFSLHYMSIKLLVIVDQH